MSTSPSRPATLALALALALATPSFAQRGPQRGEHPAVIVKRMEAQAPYDYASKFYPHPAWLYLLPAAPQAVSPPWAAGSAPAEIHAAAARPAWAPVAKQAVSR